MVIEVAMVFGKDGQPIHWHLPPGRKETIIPDTRDLWLVLMENRDRLGGVAHTHPWTGSPMPSSMDLSTFKAIENGLGKRLLWLVVTFDHVGHWLWSEEEGTYVLIPVGPGVRIVPEVQGIEKLRALSRGE